MVEMATLDEHLAPLGQCTPAVPCNADFDLRRFQRPDLAGARAHLCIFRRATPTPIATAGPASGPAAAVGAGGADGDCGPAATAT